MTGMNSILTITVPAATHDLTTIETVKNDVACGTISWLTE